MNKVASYGLALLLSSGITGIANSLPEKNNYRPLIEEVNTEAKIKKERLEIIRQLKMNLERILYNQEILQRTGEMPIYSTPITTRYNPNKKTISIIGYPSDDVNLIIYLNKKNSFSYELPLEMLNDLNQKEGRIYDFPARGWTIIKKGKKIKVEIPEEAEKFIKKVYEHGRSISK
jgi:hypothetical protein